MRKGRGRGEPGRKEEREGGLILASKRSNFMNSMGGGAVHKRLHVLSLCIGKTTNIKQMCGCRWDTLEIK